MEVAALQMSVDSSGIVKGAGDLGKLSSSAQKAATDAAKVEKAMGGINNAATRAAAAVNSEAIAMDKAAKAAWEKDIATRKAAVADQQAANRAWAASKAQEAAANSSRKASVALGQVGTAAQGAATELAGISPAANSAKASIDGVGRAANDNQRQMKSVTGNIAAQFQDVGVTAAMGMNPLIIALQQGTQLAGVLASSGADIADSLSGAFAEIFSAQSLFIIGMVAAAAALIQFVDWAEAGVTALNFLADNMVAIAPYAVAAAAAIALFYAPAILTGIATLTVAIGVGLVKAIEAAMWRLAALAVMNPWGFFILMTAAAVTALLVFRDWFTKVLGVDLVGAAHSGTNSMISSFLGAYDTIVNTWRQLPQAVGDSVVMTANIVIDTLQKMLMNSTSMLRKFISIMPGAGGLLGSLAGLAASSIGTKRIENPNAGVALRLSNEFQNAKRVRAEVDYIQEGIDGIRNGAAAVADKFREWARALGATDEKTKGSKAGAGGKSQAESLADILKGAEADIRAQQLRLDSVGKTAQAVAELEQKTKLLNAAEEAGINLTPPIRAELEKLALEYSKLKIAADVAIAIEAVTDALDKQHRGIMDDISLIGKYGDELIRAKNEMDALRQAQDALPKGVDINSPDMAGYRDDVVAAAGQKTEGDIAKRQAENAERIRRQGELDIARIDSERGAIGLSGEALLKYNYIQNEVLKAKQEGNKLSDDEIIKLNEAAEGYARNTAELERLKESMALGREVIGGFFSDWMTGMQQGGNVFKTFLNSVLDGLTKLAQKLQDKMIDNFLNSLGGGSGGGGGFLGSVGKALGFANGGAFGSSGVQQFAKGGAFTNSIVNTPTLFRFANGGALGEMGEAGPEAVMPLKRGPDGALGVQSHGGGEITINIRGDAGPLFTPTVTDIANNSAARIVHAGLNEFNDRLPDRMQEISDDPRLR